MNASPRRASIVIEAECENCQRKISKTGFPFPWFHADTGQEDCDAKAVGIQR